MSGPGLRKLNFGTIPTVGYLAIVCRFEGLPAGATSVAHLHREMQQLAHRGEWSTLRVLLARVGLEWNDPATETLKARAS